MRQPAVKAKAAARQAKERVKGDLATPDYMLRLMEHVGPTAAAKAIGTTPGTLHKARNANTVSRNIEVAARGIWHEQGYAAAEEVATAPQSRTSDLRTAVASPASDDVALLLIQVPRERSPMLLRAAEALGAVVISHD